MSGPGNDGGDDDLPWPRPDPGAAHTPPRGTPVTPSPGRAATTETARAPEEAHGRATRRSTRAERVRHRRRVITALAAIAGALVVLALAFTLWYELDSHALGPEGKQVVITVRHGEATNSVIDALSQKHVIASSLAFQVSDFFHGTPNVLPGSYALHENQTFAEVHSILAAGPNIYPVDVRPGFTLHEVAQQVDSIPGHSSGGFDATANSGAVHSTFSPPGSNDLEGMLGTGSYLVLPGETDLTILRLMVTRFDRDAQAAGLSAPSAAAVGLTPYEVITVASVVEKEGYYTKNMPDVARVIYNRLARNMALQMDSTVLYAIGQDGGPVTSQDLQIRSPYNTYLTKGLPPTPICMPSTTALTAALHPPAGNWLYFVLVKKDGTMAFSDTLAEQQANEQLAKSRGLP